MMQIRDSKGCGGSGHNLTRLEFHNLSLRWLVPLLRASHVQGTMPGNTVQLHSLSADLCPALMVPCIRNGLQMI